MIPQENHLGRVRHVNSSVPRQNRGRNMQVGRELAYDVGGSITGGILQDVEPVRLLFARLDVRVKRTAHHPEPALPIPVHMDRLGDLGIRCKKIDLCSCRQLETGFLYLHVRIGNFLQPTLGGRAQCSSQQQHYRQTCSLHNSSPHLSSLSKTTARNFSTFCSSCPISGSNMGISRALLPCSCFRKRNR